MFALAPANIPYITTKKMRSLIALFLLCNAWFLQAQTDWLTRLHDVHAN